MQVHISKQPEYDIKGLTRKELELLREIVSCTSASDLDVEGDTYDDMCDFLSDLDSLLEGVLND